MKKILVPLLIVAATTIFFTSCSSHKAATNGIVSFVAGEASINGAAAKVGAQVNVGDTVATRAHSCIVVQFYESALVTLQENSAIKIEVLAAQSDKTDKKDTVSIFQEKGSSFNKIIKDKAQYSTKTATSIAAVRGTAYTFTAAQNGSAAINLLHGKVQILPAAETKKDISTVLVDEQKTKSVVSGIASKPETLAANEKMYLTKLDKIAILPLPILLAGNFDPESVVPGDTLRMMIGQSYTGGSKQVAQANQPQNSVQPEATVQKSESIEKKSSPAMTLDELAKRYGKLSTIMTNEGKHYIGVFRQLGNSVEVMTIDGKIELPSSSVEKIEPYYL
jgi:hypothetical protein